MIVVVSDDLTGAAELAAIAWRHGLSVELQTAFHAGSTADVVCLDANTRLHPAAQATEMTRSIVRAVAAAKPNWVFKKCDSLLRGSVVAEARATAEALGLARITILPANPSRGRQVRSGHLFVEGRPLDETEFAHDPVHPRRSSSIAALLGNDLDAIEFPDAVTSADVENRARALASDTLPVGAADFFGALLALRIARRSPTPPAVVPQGATLLVCGSALAWPSRRAASPDLAFSLPHTPPAVADALSRHGRAVIGIGDGPATQGASPAELTDRLAATTARVLRSATVPLLLIEGGATAAAVFGALGWNRLAVTGSSDGIAWLSPAGQRGPIVAVKPGSYRWPASLWPT